MQVFFICCGIFLIVTWITLSTEHGKCAGEAILKIFEDLFGGKK